MFLVLLVNALFSLVFPLGKEALQYCPPFFLVGLRCVIAGLIICIYSYIRQGTWGSISRRNAKYILLLAFFNIYLTNSFEFWGLQYMSSAKTSFIYNLGPFFAAFFSYLYFKERMNSRKWIGLIIGFLGFIPIIYEESRGEGLLNHLFFISSAELALLVAVIASMYGWVIMKDFITKNKEDINMLNGISMIGGGLFSFINSLFVETWDPTPVIQWWPFLGWLSLIIIVSHFCSYPLYTYLLRHHSATFMAFTSIVSPIFAAMFDYLFFGLTVTWIFCLANVVVASGLYIFYKEEITLKELLE